MDTRWRRRLAAMIRPRKLAFFAVIISPSPSARSEPRDGLLSFVLCQGDVPANKWIVVSAEERSLFRGRVSRPSRGRQVSFAPQWSTVCASALLSSSGFRVQPEIDQAATLHRNPASVKYQAAQI